MIRSLLTLQLISIVIHHSSLVMFFFVGSLLPWPCLCRRPVPLGRRLCVVVAVVVGGSFQCPGRISFDSLILSDCCCARTSDNPRQQKMMNGSIDDSVDRLQHPTGRKCRRYSHRYLSLVLLPGRLTRLRPPMINEAKNHPNSAP